MWRETLEIHSITLASQLLHNSSHKLFPLLHNDAFSLLHNTRGRKPWNRATQHTNRTDKPSKVRKYRLGFQIVEGCTFRWIDENASGRNGGRGDFKNLKNTINAADCLKHWESWQRSGVNTTFFGNSRIYEIWLLSKWDDTEKIKISFQNWGILSV